MTSAQRVRRIASVAAAFACRTTRMRQAKARRHQYEIRAKGRWHDRDCVRGDVCRPLHMIMTGHGRGAGSGFGDPAGAPAGRALGSGFGAPPGGVVGCGSAAVRRRRLHLERADVALPRRRAREAPLVDVGDRAGGADRGVAVVDRAAIGGGAGGQQGAGLRVRAVGQRRRAAVVGEGAEDGGGVAGDVARSPSTFDPRWRRRSYCPSRCASRRCSSSPRRVARCCR